MTAFSRIGIIGLGLMGGSLARALKATGKAEYIIGYNRSLEAVQKALAERVIDKGATELEEAVEDVQCVVLCTPLGSYPKIIETIAPLLKEKTIITDVGSVKGSPIEAILPFLNEQQQKLLVPAHPIAGSELSGFEASQPELYAGRRVILTPPLGALPEAVLKVSKMWQEVGAKVEVMEAPLHDELYAQLSHVVQFLAYCFVSGLGKEFHALPRSEEFQEFIRLGGSDPVMWRDIFHYNRKALKEAATEFLKALLGLLRDIQQGNEEALQKKLSTVRKKRLECSDIDLEELLESGDDEKERKAQSVLTSAVPQLMAAALFISTAKSDIAYAGSGFLSFTRIITTLPKLHAGAQIIKEKEGILPVINRIIENVSHFSALIDGEKGDELEQEFEKSHAWYQRCQAEA